MSPISLFMSLILLFSVSGWCSHHVNSASLWTYMRTKMLRSNHTFFVRIRSTHWSEHLLCQWAIHIPFLTSCLFVSKLAPSIIIGFFFVHSFFIFVFRCGWLNLWTCYKSKIASRTISTYYTTSYRSICGIIYWTYYCTSKYMSAFWLIDWLIGFSATFSSMSAISRRPVITWVPRENHQPWASNW